MIDILLEYVYLVLSLLNYLTHAALVANWFQDKVAGQSYSLLCNCQGLNDAPYFAKVLVFVAIVLRRFFNRFEMYHTLLSFVQSRLCFFV